VNQINGDPAKTDSLDSDQLSSAISFPCYSICSSTTTPGCTCATRYVYWRTTEITILAITNKNEIIHIIPKVDVNLYNIPRVHILTLFRQKIHILYGGYYVLTVTVILCRLDVSWYIIIHTMESNHFVPFFTIQKISTNTDLEI
jgi:hypothetical protein